MDTACFNSPYLGLYLSSSSFKTEVTWLPLQREWIPWQELRLLEEDMVTKLAWEAKEERVSEGRKMEKGDLQ